MNELNTILEKISTLNINANTNIDIQGIVNTYMKFDVVKSLAITFVTGLVVIIIAIMVLDIITQLRSEIALEKYDIQKYIPRNKKHTKID